MLAGGMLAGGMLAGGGRAAASASRAERGKILPFSGRARRR